MGLLEPAGLFAGILAIPILALWILRPRRRPRIIGSTLLWRQALDNVEASHPWQRLRWHVLLALQLAAIALFAVAIARPFLLSASDLTDQTYVVLDASASMQATDVKPNRFAVAKTMIGETIDRLPPGGQLTIVLMADEPRLLVARSGDRRALHAALDAARPSNEGANLAAALGLIAPLAAGHSEAQTLVYSDGGTDDATRVGRFPFAIRWIRVGGPSENVGIAAFAVGAGESGPVALARIANFGARPASGQVELWADSRLYDVRSFVVAPGESASESWANLPTGANALEARLRGSDAFSLDDRADATVTAGKPTRVLLITPGNPFLQQALKLAPGVDLTVADHVGGGANADVVVYDGVAPARLPLANVLLVHPPVGDVPWSIGPDRPVGLLRTVASSEINRLLDLSQVHVRDTRGMTLPSNAETVIADPDGPLIAVEQSGRSRIGVIGFDLHQSDLPLDPSFPVLISNLVDWLKPGSSAAGHSVAPSSPVSVSTWPAASRVELVRPDGSRERLAPPFPPRLIADTEQLGLYQIVQSAPGQPDRVSWFTVNQFSSRESDLNPPATLPVAQSAGNPTTTAPPVPEDLWPWLAAAALLVLLAEWWAYRRTA